MRSLATALCVLALCACARKIQGPTPTVSGALSERDQSTAPAYLCNTLGDPTDGWLIDVLGDNFAPLPTNSLAGAPGIDMPAVRLDGPESYTVPPAYVRFIDKTRLRLAMRTADSAADPHMLTPGDYSVTVTNLNGASGTSPAAAIRVTSCVSLGTLAMSPRFGWANKNQSITISNTFNLTGTPPTHGFSGGAPTVTISAPINGSTTAVQIPLRRVAFINANTITAVVPTCSGASATPFSQLPPATCPNGIAPGGPYTISVQDPNGAGGVLSGGRGFVVLPNEPPVIASIAPTAIDTGGTADLLISSGGVTGTNFAATSKPQIVFQAGANIRACDLPINSQTTSAIHAMVPGSVAQANCVEYDPTGAQVAATGGFSLGVGLYVIRVQDTADPANGDYSGLVVTQPSKKPSNSQDAGAALAKARADFPLVQATDDIGNQYLYALGGIDGPVASGTALSSVEVAQITEFGALGSFALLDRTALGYIGGSGTTAAPRHGLGAAAVTIPGDTSYIFVVGGIDASGHAMKNVERAQVLKAADAPVIDSPITGGAGGSLAAGTYYYKVSALLAATDANNPGGETLASDLEPVTIPSTGAGTATLTWPCLAGAVKYRIFRTVNANDPAGTEHLVAEPAKSVMTCSGSPLPNESFTDNGGTTPSGLKPQPAGALGRWVSQPALPTARGALAVKLVGDRIFAVGGCTATTGSPACNASGSETATIDIATLAANAINSTYGSATLSVARRNASITVANKLTAPGEFTSTASNLNDTWLMVLYGAAAGSVLSNSVEVAKVIANSSDVATPTFGSASYGNFSFTGGWAEAIADLLLVYGNTNLGTGFDFRVPQGSNTICGTGQCTSNTSFSANLTSASSAPTSRYLPGEVLFRAYVYAAGGLTDATSGGTAQATVDRILY